MKTYSTLQKVYRGIGAYNTNQVSDQLKRAMGSKNISFKDGKQSEA